MADGLDMSTEEAELNAAIDRILMSQSRKKLVVSGPGTGKTALFRRMLESAKGNPDRRLVLTFINKLRDDLAIELSGRARVSTLHSHCLGLLYSDAALRDGLSPGFRCRPGLGSLIRADWQHIEKCKPPHFVREMRNLDEENHVPFYLARGDYYDAVDFDDTVYRVYKRLASGTATLDVYDLVLIDEYQDFNRLEAAFIDLLAEKSPIMIVGDDDQALYSQLRDSSWDYIRSLYRGGEYEIFELPYCMRCPKVVVDAVRDVIARAHQLKMLKGRIEKPYKHFALAKGPDSKKYPKIALIETSVQRQNANYMGRYIARVIGDIPRDEIEAAARGGYPAALVIAANPYRTQIIDHLEKAGYAVDTRRDPEGIPDRECGLDILKKDQGANLGWRIVLQGEQPSFAADIIRKTVDGARRLVDVLPDDYRDRLLAEVDAWSPPEEEPDEKRETDETDETPVVRVTTFEGAKGLSAQHVFIAGLHDGEIPRDPNDIRDIEICKFVVGLTRTRKKCSLVYTRRFANRQKAPSSFISWIDCGRLELVKVDAGYWS